MDVKPIPVSIITGFLGSGKTTLLNQIIAKYSNKRIVIIENEFGEINVDKELISNIAKGDVFELTNGCICCSIQNELETTLNSLILSNTHYDHLIIETTGIADPGDIIKIFLSGKRVQRYFTLDSVICVVDALYFNEQYEKNIEVERQLAHSNIILLNKIDLIKKELLEELSFRLSMNGDNKVFPVIKCDIQEIEVLDKFFFSKESINQDIVNYKHVKPYFGIRNKHHIKSALFSFERNFKSKLFEFWLEQFLHVNNDLILRVKGIISIPESDKKIIVQAVKESITIYEGEYWGEEPRMSQLIFIGSQIKESDIQEALEVLLDVK